MKEENASNCFCQLWAISGGQDNGTKDNRNANWAHQVRYHCASFIAHRHSKEGD